MAEFVSIRDLQRDKGETTPATDDEAAPQTDALGTRFEETLEIADIKVEPEMDRGRHRSR